MQPLYRLMTRERWEKFWDDGVLWISTLYSLANEEANGRGTFDINEGSRALTYMGRCAEVPHQVLIPCIDSWVLCFSDKITPRMLKEWADRDFMFQVSDRRFFDCITDAMGERAALWAVDKVQYGDWIGGADFSRWYDSRYPLATTFEPRLVPYIGFLKDEDMRYMCEWRGVWEPKPTLATQPPPIIGRAAASVSDLFFRDRASYRAAYGRSPNIEPFLLNVPEARRYVTPLGKPRPIR